MKISSNFYCDSTIYKPRKGYNYGPERKSRIYKFWWWRGGGGVLRTGESGEYFEGESEDLVNFQGEGGSVDRGIGG